MRRAVRVLAWLGLAALAAPSRTGAAARPTSRCFTATLRHHRRTTASTPAASATTAGGHRRAQPVRHRRRAAALPRQVDLRRDRRRRRRRTPTATASPTSTRSRRTRRCPATRATNFFDAIDRPPDWHTFITPGVPSCLEPKDIRADADAARRSRRTWQDAVRAGHHLQQRQGRSDRAARGGPRTRPAPRRSRSSSGAPRPRRSSCPRSRSTWARPPRPRSSSRRPGRS